VRLSVVVVVYDMPNAAPRTLRTLAADYQRDLREDEYEVIVVDNGSRQPLPADVIASAAANVRFLSLASPQPSPAAAANLGLSLARGRIVALVLDGARLATPRLLSLGVRAAESHPRAVVTTRGWLLGRTVPTRFATGDAAAADRTEAILRAVGWPSDPDRLLEVARLDGSMGWFGLGFESSALFLPRALWDELGGLDERFDEAGGGFVALDLYARAVALPDCEPMLLLGEATVHQPHGGAATDRPADDHVPRFMRWRDHYIALRGHDLPVQSPPLTYFGTLPTAWRVQFAAWVLRETLSEVPELAHVVARMDAALAADATPQGSAWSELYAVQAALVDLQRAASSPEADSWRQAYDAIRRSWSWRLTAPLRRLAQLFSRG
jgi:glycosyltransferase involved in cell wall biosynthesis